MKRFKPFLIAGFLLFAGVMAAAAGLLAYASSGHAGRLAARQIDRFIPGSVAFENHRIYPWKGTLGLSGLLLRDASGKPVAGCDRLMAGLSIRGLLQGRLQFIRIALVHPWVDARLDAKGRLDLAAALQAPIADRLPATESATGAAGALAVVVDTVTVADGEFRLWREADGSRVTLKGVRLSGNADTIRQTAALALDAGTIEWRTPGREISLDRLRIEAALDSGRLTLSTVSVTGPGGTGSLGGTITRLLDRPHLAIDFRTRLSLSEIGKGFGLPHTATGILGADGRIAGFWDDPDVHLDLAVEGPVIDGWPLTGISAHLALNDRQVALSNASVKSPAGTVSITGEIDLRNACPSGLAELPKNLDAISWTLALTAAGLELGGFPAIHDRWSGTVDATARVGGTGFRPDRITARGQVQVAGRDLRHAGAPDALSLSAGATAQFDGRQITVASLDASLGDAVFHAAGRVDTVSRALGLDLFLSAPDLGRSLKLLGVTPASGTLRIEGRVSGTVPEPLVSGRVYGAGVQVRSVRLGDIDADVRIDTPGVLEIRHLAIHSRGSRIRASGRVPLVPGAGRGTPPPAALSLWLENVAPADFYDQERLHGRLTGTLTIGGTADRLTAETDLTIPGLAVDRWRLGDARLRMRWEDGRLVLEAVDLRQGPSAVNLKGDVRILAPGTRRLLADPVGRLEMTASHVRIGDFVEGIHGVVSGRIELSGTVGDPNAIISLAATDLDALGQKADALRVEARIAEKILHLTELTLTVAEESTLHGTGWISTDRRFNLHMATRGIPLVHIDRFRQQDIATGMVTAEIKAWGSVDNPSAAGTLTVKDFRVNRRPLDDVALELSLEDRLARFRGRLNFDLDGTVDLGSRHLSARVRFDETDLTPYFRLAGHPEFSGTVTGAVDLSGDIRHPETIRGMVDIAHINASRRDTVILRDGRISGSLEKRHLTLNGVRLDLLSSARLTVQGTIDAAGRMALTGEGHLPVADVAPFTDALAHAAGTIDLAADVAGTIYRPEGAVRVALDGIGFDLPEVAQSVSHGQGRLVLTPDALVVEALSGRIDSGTFGITGRVEIADLRPRSARLAFRGDRIPLSVPDTVSVVLNAGLSVEGTPQQARISGDVQLLGGEYVKDVRLNLIRGITQRRRPAPPQPPEPAADSLWAATTLEIDVTRRSPFVIANNIAQIDLSPDLKVTGTLARPVVTGRAAIDGGTLQYRKKQFTVTGGAVDFVNPYRIEPDVRIQGETTVRDWTVYLDVQGPPDALDFRLRSEPPAADGDILSLLLFGRTTRELIDGEGGAAVSPAQTLAGLLASALEGDVRDATGLDQFQVDTGGAGSTGAATGDDVRVTVGKSLSRRLTLKYAAGSSAGEWAQRAIAEYKLMENMLINAYQGSRGAFGGELRFRLEFR